MCWVSLSLAPVCLCISFFGVILEALVSNLGSLVTPKFSASWVTISKRISEQFENGILGVIAEKQLIISSNVNALLTSACQRFQTVEREPFIIWTIIKQTSTIDLTSIFLLHRFSWRSFSILACDLAFSTLQKIHLNKIIDGASSNCMSRVEVGWSRKLEPLRSKDEKRNCDCHVEARF